MLAAAEVQLKAWAKPIAQLRARVGLPPYKANPLLRGNFSPLGTLALFSRHFAPPQPDWPPSTTATGFVFYDRQGALRGAVKDARTLGGELLRFLDAGPEPVLFTLGSSAVAHPGTFFQESLAAVKRMGIRAVMLVGPFERAQLPADVPDSVFVTSYLPYSEVMPRSAAVVHQGGIGTTAQTLRAGRPMLVVPWSHDQPDNAARLTRLGVARTLPRERYTAARVEAELSRLLADGNYREKAAAMGGAIASEDGLAAVCDAITNHVNAIL